MRPTLDDIEDLELSAWPGLRSAHRRGWLIRTARGFTRRANSAMPIRDGADLDAADIAIIEALYARHGRPALIRLTHKAAAGLDRRLEDCGYAMLTPSELRVAPLRPVPADPTVAVAETLPGDWIEAFGRANGRTDFEPAAMADIIAGVVPPTGFARVAEGDETIAVGMAVAIGGLVELQSIAVAPAHRGRGLGRRVLEALMTWGANLGAEHAVLSVEAGNASAMRLYDSLGFRPVGRYHYRQQPK